MSFKIIVDSCCDLTPAQLREDCFVSVPLTIRVGEHIVVDDASFDQGALLWYCCRLLNTGSLSPNRVD